MRRLCNLVACLMVATAPAMAAEAVKWSEVDGWSVLMDPTMGNACYVSTAYEDGTVLRLGFNFLGPQGALYLALGNQNWKSLEAGKDYPVVIKFDTETPWDAVATAMEFSDINWLTIQTTDMGFAGEFAAKHSLLATFEGRQITKLRLKGSSKAVAEMLNCQDAVKAYSSKKELPAPSPADPFATSPEVKSTTDPFAL
jgi:hypothetical protein